MTNEEFNALLSRAQERVRSFNRPDCIAHHFRLVKIKLPPEIFDLLQIQTINQATSDPLNRSFGDIIAEFSGVPVEKDWTLTLPRYVIEADSLEILEKEAE